MTCCALRIRAAMLALASFVVGLRVSGWVAAEAPSVWLAHWLAGSACALLALAAFQVLARRDARGALPALLAGQAFGLLPDVLARFEVSHAAWMDLFALHMRIDTAAVPLLLSFAALLAAIGLFLGSAHVNDLRQASD